MTGRVRLARFVALALAAGLATLVPAAATSTAATSTAISTAISTSAAAPGGPVRAAVGFPRLEPPDVRGLPLRAATDRLLSEWYADSGVVRQVQPRGEPPDELPEEQVLVVDQQVLSYPSGVLPTTPPTPPSTSAPPESPPPTTPPPVSPPPSSVPDAPPTTTDPSDVEEGPGDDDPYDPYDDGPYDDSYTGAAVVGDAARAVVVRAVVVRAVVVRAVAHAAVREAAVRYPVASIQLILGTVVPDLTGRTLLDARTDAAGRGLLVTAPPDGRDGDLDARRDAGSGARTVRAQRPEAGALLPFGAAIGVGLRTARVPALGLMPSVLGLSSTKARELLRDLDPRITIETLGTAPRVVVAQQPPPGAEVSSGLPVRLTVWGPLPSVVPALDGLTEAQARHVLAPTGLVLSVGSGPRDGRVRTQVPLAGSSVAPGTVVVVDLESVSAGAGSDGAGSDGAGSDEAAPRRLSWTWIGVGALAAGTLITARTAIRARRRPGLLPLGRILSGDVPAGDEPAGDGPPVPSPRPAVHGFPDPAPSTLLLPDLVPDLLPDLLPDVSPDVSPDLPRDRAPSAGRNDARPAGGRIAVLVVPGPADTRLVGEEDGR